MDLTEELELDDRCDAADDERAYDDLHRGEDDHDDVPRHEWWPHHLSGDCTYDDCTHGPLHPVHDQVERAATLAYRAANQVQR